MPWELQSIKYESSFWTGVEIAQFVYDHVCRWIGILEADEATMGTVYASARSMRMHMFYSQHINDTNIGTLGICLVRQWKGISSPLHSLAVKCDVMFNITHQHAEVS